MTKGHLITGLDIGTGNIKMLVALKKPQDKVLEVISQAEVSNFGMRKGVVINPDEVASKIREALDFCQEGLEKKINSAVVSINGSHLTFLPSRGLASVSRADQRISDVDIERALQASRTLSLSANQEILDVFPQEFIIDGQSNIKEAEGLRGIRLEAKTLCVAVFSPYLKNLTEAVLQAGLEIDNISPSVLASSEAVLTPKEKELGVVMIEIGAGTTGLAIFEEGSLTHAAVLPIGSNNITNDIAYVMRLETESAEEAKKTFPGFGSRKRGSGRDKKKSASHGYSSKNLARVVEARTREIFGEVVKELKRVNKTRLPAGAVLTGGGAELIKIVDFAKKELRLPCRLGLAKGFAPELDDPSFSAVAGLILEAAKDIDFDSHSSFLEKGIFKKAKNFFKVFVP